MKDTPITEGFFSFKGSPNFHEQKVGLNELDVSYPLILAPARRLDITFAQHEAHPELIGISEQPWVIDQL
jgi:hypothetical protein